MNGVSGYGPKRSTEPQRANVQYTEYRQYYCTISKVIMLQQGYRSNLCN